MDKILNNLGLCQRANGLLSGEEMVIEGIQSGKVYYVFLASDAWHNTSKLFLFNIVKEIFPIHKRLTKTH
jgi:ribosomal protein L7Ae-like RNA K-turn-binding protein